MCVPFGVFIEPVYISQYVGRPRPDPHLWGKASLPITNFAFLLQRLTKGTAIGRVEPVQDQADPATASDMVDVCALDTTDDDAPWKGLDFEARVCSDRFATEKSRLVTLLSRYYRCFAGPDDDYEQCTIAQHVIDTGTAKPVHQHPFPAAWKQREIIQEQVEKIMKQGIIEPSHSPWSSPVVLVKKKCGEWRFCVDYRRLNAVTVKDVYPLPRIDEALGRLQGSSIFSIMDLQSGYHQIALRKRNAQCDRHPGSLQS